MARYPGKTCRLLTMLSMTASFFLVEIIVGYITNSIALVADSFHMLSDVVALIVGFASVRVSLHINKYAMYIGMLIYCSRSVNILIFIKMQSTSNRVHNIKIKVDHILNDMYIPDKAQYRKRAELKNVKICMST